MRLSNPPKCGQRVAEPHRAAPPLKEVIIATLIRRRSDAPGDLAQELADARERFEAKRSDIVDRGVTRQQDIAAMQKELAEEQLALDKVIESA